MEGTKLDPKWTLFVMVGLARQILFIDLCYQLMVLVLTGNDWLD